MRKFQLAQQLGIILIGFALYEAIYGKWASFIALPSFLGEFRSEEFGIAKALVVYGIMLCTYMVITYREYVTEWLVDFESKVEKQELTAADFASGNDIFVKYGCLSALWSVVPGAIFLLFVNFRSFFLYFLGMSLFLLSKKLPKFPARANE